MITFLFYRAWILTSYRLTASCLCLSRLDPVTVPGGLVCVPPSVVVAVLAAQDRGVRLRSGAVVAASVAPLADVPFLVAVLAAEDPGARLRSGAAVVAFVAPLADALSEVVVAAAAVSCAPVERAELVVAAAAVLSALVLVLAFLLALPGFAPVAYFLRQRAERSAVEFDSVSAAARAVAFAGEHLYCLGLPQQRSGPFAVYVLRPSLAQVDLTFELLPAVAHP